MEASRIYKLSMSPEQVEKFQAFFMERSGLVFEGRRVPEMEKAIAKRMIALGISSFDEYYQRIQRGHEGREEINQLAIFLTVGETCFFRTPDQFAALRKYVLPEIIERQRERGKKLRILSAGCSTGEEPYSLGILARQLIPDVDSWNVEIVACDINKDFLATAKAGAYGERKVRLADPVTRGLFFKRLAKNQWMVGDNLREHITWRHFNIISDDYSPLAAGGQFHVVLCRNVLIYFKMDTIKRVIKKLHDIIEP